MTVKAHDEYLHSAPEGFTGLYSDNFWLSICDREADIFGVNHIHAAVTRGYARFSTMMVIDGMSQPGPARWRSARDSS